MDIKTILHTLAWFYIVVHIAVLVWMPYKFGKERDPLTFSDWIMAIVITVPIILLLLDYLGYLFN